MADDRRGGGLPRMADQHQLMTAVGSPAGRCLGRCHQRAGAVNDRRAAPGRLRSQVCCDAVGREHDDVSGADLGQRGGDTRAEVGECARGLGGHRDLRQHVHFPAAPAMFGGSLPGRAGRVQRAGAPRGTGQQQGPRAADGGPLLDRRSCCCRAERVARGGRGGDHGRRAVLLRAGDQVEPGVEVARRVIRTGQLGEAGPVALGLQRAGHESRGVAHEQAVDRVADLRGHHDLAAVHADARCLDFPYR